MSEESTTTSANEESTSASVVSNPRLPNTDWKKEIETIRERIRHCQTTAARLKATLEPVSRELSTYNDLLRRRQKEEKNKAA